MYHQLRPCKMFSHNRLPDKLLCCPTRPSEFEDILHSMNCISYIFTVVELHLGAHPVLPFSLAQHDRIGGRGFLSPFCICLLVCFLFRAGSVPACWGNPGYPLSACAPSDGPREYTKVSAFRRYLCFWL